jgi:hypothetical protein
MKMIHLFGYEEEEGGEVRVTAARGRRAWAAVLRLPATLGQRVELAWLGGWESARASALSPAALEERWGEAAEVKALASERPHCLAVA